VKQPQAIANCLVFRAAIQLSEAISP
jgi:hypothetical protein